VPNPKSLVQVFAVETRAKPGEEQKIILGEIRTGYFDDTSRRMERTLKPASKPTQILVRLALRQFCFFPAFKHCSIMPRRESMPALS